MICWQIDECCVGFLLGGDGDCCFCWMDGWSGVWGVERGEGGGCGGGLEFPYYLIVGFQ